MSFRGKSIVVTGSTSGIGRATAEAFGREGASIVLVGRNETVLSDVAAVVHAAGGEATRCPVVLTSAPAAAAVVKTAIDAYGHLDVLVNAAGVIASGTLEQTTDEMWDQMIAVNMTAPFRLMRA